MERKVWYFDYEKTPKGCSYMNTYHRKVVAPDFWTAMRKAKLGITKVMDGGYFISALEVDTDGHPIQDGERYMRFGWGKDAKVVYKFMSPEEKTVEIPEDM